MLSTIKNKWKYSGKTLKDSIDSNDIQLFNYIISTNLEEPKYLELLEYALLNQKTKFTTKLVKNITNIDYQSINNIELIDYLTKNLHNYNINLQLESSINNNEIELVKYIFRNYKIPKESYFLTLAINNQNYKIIKYLIDIQNFQLDTLLNSNYEILKFILKRFPNTELINKEKLLFEYIDNIKILKLLLEHTIQINIKNNNITLLSTAINNNNLELVKILLYCNADIIYLNDDNTSPIILLGLQIPLNLEILKFILKYVDQSNTIHFMHLKCLLYLLCKNENIKGVKKVIKYINSSFEINHILQDIKIIEYLENELNMKQEYLTLHELIIEKKLLDILDIFEHYSASSF